MNTKKIALFDLDHTLIPLDSDFAWGEFTTDLGWTDAENFRQQNRNFYEQYVAGTLDIHAYCRFTTAAMVRQGAAKSIAAHADFMATVIRHAIQPQALKLVQDQQAAGATVIIVTATNAFVTRPIAKAFGVDELIAIDLVKDDAPGGTGWFTGEIAGTPSFREGKVSRMSQWLEQRNLNWDRVHTTFYSDSFNDVPLLEKVNVAVTVNPDPRLRTLALQRKWPVIDLFN